MFSNKEHADVAVVDYISHCLLVYSRMYLFCFFPASRLPNLKERNSIVENNKHMNKLVPPPFFL